MVLSKRERDTVIRTIIGEAANQDAKGWAGVAHVIANRSRDGSFPNSPAKVARQPKQFSAWNDKDKGGNDLVRKHGPESSIYQRVGQVVDGVFSGSIPDPTGGATHYWAPNGMPGGRDPYWANAEVSRQGAQRHAIGDHVFLARSEPVSLPKGFEDQIAGGQQNSLPEAALALSGERSDPAGLEAIEQISPQGLLAGASPATGQIPLPKSPDRLAAIDSGQLPDLPQLTFATNPQMSPLLSSRRGASRLTRKNAADVMAETLTGPAERMQQEFRLRTGRDLPPINDAIAKEGTSREVKARGSQHFKGTALDISTRGLSDQEKLALAESAQRAGFSGLGFGENILHTDTGPQRAWGYGNRTFGGKKVSDLDSAHTATGKMPKGTVSNFHKGAPLPRPRPETRQDLRNQLQDRGAEPNVEHSSRFREVMGETPSRLPSAPAGEITREPLAPLAPRETSPRGGHPYANMADGHSDRFKQAFAAPEIAKTQAPARTPMQSMQATPRPSTPLLSPNRTTGPDRVIEQQRSIPDRLVDGAKGMARQTPIGRLALGQSAKEQLGAPSTMADDPSRPFTPGFGVPSQVQPSGPVGGVSPTVVPTQQITPTRKDMQPMNSRKPTSRKEAAGLLAGGLVGSLLGPAGAAAGAGLVKLAQSRGIGEGLFNGNGGGLLSGLLSGNPNEGKNVSYSNDSSGNTWARNSDTNTVNYVANRNSIFGNTAIDRIGAGSSRPSAKTKSAEVRASRKN